MLDKIRKLVQDRKMQEALDILNSKDMLDNKEEDYFWLKSICLAGIGEYDDSLSVLEEVLDSSNTISLWQKAGQLAIQLRKTDIAIKYFSEAIRLSKEQSNEYFLSDCYLQRAHCYSESREFEKAIKDLGFVNDASNISWIKGIAPLSKKSILQKIT